MSNKSKGTDYIYLKLRCSQRDFLVLPFTTAVLILSTLEAVEQCVIKSLKFRLNSWVCGSALTAAILEGYHHLFKLSFLFTSLKWVQ